MFGGCGAHQTPNTVAKYLQRYMVSHLVKGGVIPSIIALADIVPTTYTKTLHLSPLGRSTPNGFGQNGYGNMFLIALFP